MGATVDPLRDNNPDFDLVGPGWVAVLVFAALALAFGVVLASFMARLSAWLPLLSAERRVLVRYIPVGLVAAVGFSVSAVLVIVGSLIVLLTRWRPIVRFPRSAGFLRAGRAVLALVVIGFTPNAVSSVADIASR
jgi:hypothetical protein